MSGKIENFGTQKFINLKNLRKIKSSKKDTKSKDSSKNHNKLNKIALNKTQNLKKFNTNNKEKSDLFLLNPHGLDSSRELNFTNNFSILDLKESQNSHVDIKNNIGEDTEGYYSSRRNSKFEEMMKITFSQGSPKTKNSKLNLTINSLCNSNSSDDQYNKTIDIVDCTLTKFNKMNEKCDKSFKFS